MNRIRTTFLTLLTMMASLPVCRADVLMKPWDVSYAAVMGATDKKIPEEFKSEQHTCFVETISEDEFANKCLDSLYPQEKANVKIIVGIYLPRKGKSPQPLPRYGCVILLKEGRTEGQVATTFVHEYGHFVDAEILTDEEHKEWKTLWGLAYENNRLPTQYATVNRKEGFADCFAFYCFRKNKLDISIKFFFDRVSDRLKLLLPPKSEHAAEVYQEVRRQAVIDTRDAPGLRPLN